MRLLALVFTRRPIALTWLARIVVGHLGLYYHATRASPLAGYLEFAADALLRDGLIAFGFVVCFGALLATMIESAHQRSEEALRATRTANGNLETLVAERTRNLEAAAALARKA